MRKMANFMYYLELLNLFLLIENMSTYLKWQKSKYGLPGLTVTGVVKPLIHVHG